MGHHEAKRRGGGTAFAVLVALSVSHLLREKARLEMDTLIAEFDSKLPKVKRKKPMKEGWTLRSAAFAGRLGKRLG